MEDVNWTLMMILHFETSMNPIQSVRNQDFFKHFAFFQQKNGSIPWTHYFTSIFFASHSPRRENSLTKVFVGNFADNDVFQSDTKVIIIDTEVIADY